MTRWLTLLFLCAACGPVQNDCATIDCGTGECVVGAEGARCLCDDGFIATGLRCIASSLACTTASCTQLLGSSCVVGDGGLQCLCPTGLSPIDGVCRVQVAMRCLPNPCTALRKNQCDVVEGTARCSCNPGYAPEGDGCGATPVWTCASQHQSGDSAEPDECPPFAAVMALSTSSARSIEPAGDLDWFRLEVEPGQVIEVSATSQSIELLLEVFDAPGTTLRSADTRGVLTPITTFRVSHGDGLLLVRVRALHDDATGPYTLISRLLDADDFANTPEDAPHLMSGPIAVTGAVQYPGDFDVVWLMLEADQSWHFTVAQSPLTGSTQVELQRVDGGSVIISELGAGITVSQREEVLLIARGSTPQSTGAFSIGVETLGPDDYSDTPQLGTQLDLDQPVLGRLERSDDVDGFRFQVTAGHIYLLHAAVVSSSGAVSITVTDDTRVLLRPNEETAFEADRTEEVFVAVATAFQSGTIVEWVLSAEDLGLDDFTDLAPGASLALGRLQAGRLELATDVDVFRVAAPGGRVLRAELTLPATANATLTVVDTTGATLATGPSPLNFFSASAGAVDVFVSGGAANTRYTLQVTDVGGDDFGDTPAEATPVALQAPLAGALQYPGDVDAFSFTAVANHVYDVDTGGGVRVDLLQTNTQSTVWDDTAGMRSFLSGVSGTAVLLVRSATGGATSHSYQLTVVDRGIEDHAATPASATPVLLDTPVSGRLGFAGDVDAFSVNVTAGRVFAARLDVSGLTLQVFSPGGVPVTGSTVSNDVRFLAELAGPYTVLVSGPGSSTSPGYQLTLSDSGIDDFGESTVGAASVTVGTAMPAGIQYGADVDTFALPVTPGRFYEARCTAAVSGCFIEVLDGNGTFVASSGFSRSNVAFKAVGSAVMYLRVQSTGAIFSYTLMVSDLGADDHGDTVAAATPIAVGPLVDGTLEIATDVDVFTFTATAGQILKTRCTGMNGFNCTQQLRNPNGTGLLQSVYGQSLNVLITQSGTWSLSVRASSVSTGFAYQVRVDEVTDDHGNDNASATPLTLGVPIAGIINYAGDVDAFSFTASTTPLDFSITGGDTWDLEVRDANDVVVTTFSPPMTWLPPAPGAYVVRLVSYAGPGAAVSYSLLVR